MLNIHLIVLVCLFLVLNLHGLESLQVVDDNLSLGLPHRYAPCRPTIQEVQHATLFYLVLHIFFYGLQHESSEMRE